MVEQRARAEVEARARALALASALIALAPASARADPPPRAGLSLGATAALDSFAQGDGSPPLCCGERDQWTARGPAFALRAGYGLLPWLEPTLELGASFQHADGVSLTTTTAALGVDFPIGGERFAFIPGLYLRTGRQRASFERSAGSTTTTETIDQDVSAPGLSLGGEWLVVPAIGAGVFVRADRVAISQADYAAGVAVTWYGVGR